MVIRRRESVPGRKLTRLTFTRVRLTCDSMCCDHH
jgi:hypothetical protein